MLTKLNVLCIYSTYISFVKLRFESTDWCLTELVINVNDLYDAFNAIDIIKVIIAGTDDIKIVFVITIVIEDLFVNVMLIV